MEVKLYMGLYAYDYYKTRISDRRKPPLEKARGGFINKQ